MPTTPPALKALCVGINAYAAQPLACAVTDAVEIAEALRAGNTGADVEVLQDLTATRAKILESMRALASSRSRHKILYMAGHAAALENGVYFVPFGDLEWTDWLSFRQIGEVMSIGTGDLTIILDCCHAGALTLDTAFRFEDYERALSMEVLPRNTSAFLACTLGTEAREDPRYRHGVFTFHLLKGLAGGAADDDKKVTIGALHTFISRQMRLNERQVPVFRATTAGEVVVCDAAPYGPSAHREQQRNADISRMVAALETAHSGLAELKPPFASRESYRATGWLKASKLVHPVAELRGKMLERWPEDELLQNSSWRSSTAEVDAMLGELAIVGPGYHTEFGTIDEEIGRGGFGAVFRVGSEYAYKVMHGVDIANRSKLERFRTGYNAMNRLAHPQIVKVWKLVESPLSFYMEYVPGPNLRKWHGTTTEPSDLLKIYLEISSVIETAHGSGVLHRDLKPENVLVRMDNSGQWIPILTDFDLAWFTNASTHTVEAFGAPFYAAPEQLMDPGGAASHEPAVDIYGLGALGYFLLTGRDPMDKLEAHAALVRVTAQWSSVSAARIVIDVLDRATKRRASERYPIIRLMREELLSAWQHLVQASTPDAALSRLDFVQRIGVYMASEWTMHGELAHITSSSRRNRAEIAIEDATLRIGIQKLGIFQAQGVTINEARLQLRRRVDKLVAEHPNMRRSGSATDRTMIFWEGCGYTDAEARTAASLVISLFAIHDAF